MKDGHWVRQRGDAANRAVGTESNSQIRGYNGQASQETNHPLGSESYIEFLSGDLKSKSSLQAKHPLHDAGSTSSHNLWISSKGARWNSVWESLHSEVDEAPCVQESREPYESAKVAGDAAPLANIMQSEQIIVDGYDDDMPFSNLSSSTIRRVLGSIRTSTGDPTIKDSLTKPNRALERAPSISTTRSSPTDTPTLPSSQNEDPTKHLKDFLSPEAESPSRAAPQLSSEMPNSFTPLEISDEIPDRPDQDVGDEEFLEKVQFAPTSIQQELALHVQTPLTAEIHILGINPIGLHVAHSLSTSLDPPPVTLLMHRPLSMQQWHEEGAAIRVVRNGFIYSSSNYNVESAALFGVNDGTSTRTYPGFGEHLEHTAEQPNTRIANLIVTTKAQQTTAALAAIKHRLDYNSTICFMNHGLGIIEEVNVFLFPDPETRPFYMQARNGHNIRPIDNHKFSISEQNMAELSFSICNRLDEHDRIAPSKVERQAQWAPSSRYILRRFTNIPELCATGYDRDNFLKYHLQKVAINSIIGPSSVMYDCFAHELLFNRWISQSVTSLLEEISSVLVSLPEMENVRDKSKFFSVDKLWAVTRNQCDKIGKNRTWMWHDVNDGLKTDIDYFNGYIINRGEELGIDCTRLRLLTTMVKAKQMIKKQEMDSYIEWEKDSSMN